MKRVANPDFGEMLHSRGFKTTPGRIALLRVLKQFKEPLSILRITKELGNKLNPATVYRALEALVDSGMVRKVDLQHSHAHYELVEGNEHHHHLICQICGEVEDVGGCNPKTLEKSILRFSRNFKEIRSHSLEFFGHCRSCVKA